eukprot:870202_1
MSAEWTDEDVESVLKTTACAVIVAGVLYYLFFPKLREDPEDGQGQVQRQQQNANVQQRQMQHQRGQARGQGQGPSRQNYNRHGVGASASQEDDEDEDGIAAYLKQHTRKPPHFEISSTSTAASNNNNSAHRHDGIVPFRLTKASHYEMKQKAALADTEEEAQAKALEVRKDRARIFAKLFASNNILPPGRGGTLVLSIPSGSAASMQKVLALLGTYYNLFVMVALEQEDESGLRSVSGKSDEYTAVKQKSKEIVDDFYEGENTGLSRDVLPPHRIIMTRSVASRIAFVRAFPKSPEYVISIGVDGEDKELKDQLTKFGFNVMLRSSASILL